MWVCVGPTYFVCVNVGPTVYHGLVWVLLVLYVLIVDPTCFLCVSVVPTGFL